MLLSASGYASAEIVDDINLKTDANGEVDAVVKFNVPVQYLRHFPQQKSSYLTVYFNILDNGPNAQWVDYESHRSPPSDLILDITVTTRELKSGPKIEVQFTRPVEVDVTMGKNNQTILLHIKPAPVPANVAPAPAISAAAVIPTLPPSPVPAMPPAIPKIAAVTAPVAAAPIAPVVAAAPIVAPSIPAAPIPAPTSSMANIAAAPTAIKTPPAQFDGRDGLPPFPNVQQEAKPATVAPSSEPQSLAELIKTSNAQAAILMSKGRDALFSGQLFAAIDAFNETLKLPANKYSSDAQLWIGVTREKAGQLAKARLEYETYQKLYPEGTSSKWVKDRLARLNALLPPPQTAAQPMPTQGQSTPFQIMEYGSLSSYYYYGLNQIDTTTTVANVPTQSSLTVNDQSAMISNVIMTARAYNNEYDNRVVFQDLYSRDFLPGRQNRNRLNAAYVDIKNRIDGYSVRAGRQSAYGGGVLGRFDGISAGYSFLPDWRANIVAGQLSDIVIGSQPIFYGGSVDFGVKSSLGGSLYAINQTVGGMLDRSAVGGNMRYFDQHQSLIGMLDYDLQIGELNMVTVQGTLNSESGVDYNFLIDRRRSPTLSISSSVNGTSASVDTLLQNGWTRDDLIALAKLRSAISTMAQFGITDHLNADWQLSTDLTASNTTGLSASGTLIEDGTTGLEGFVAATPDTGIAWTLTERIIGNNVISVKDTSMCSVSYSKSDFMSGKTLLLNSRSYSDVQWTFDKTLRFYLQTDYTGGTQNTVSPILRVSYRIKNTLTLETEGGMDVSTITAPSALQSSKTNRKYLSVGFRWDI